MASQTRRQSREGHAATGGTAGLAARPCSSPRDEGQATPDAARPKALVSSEALITVVVTLVGHFRMGRVIVWLPARLVVGDDQGRAAVGVPVPGLGADEVLAAVVGGVGRVEHQVGRLAGRIGFGHGRGRVPRRLDARPPRESLDDPHPGAAEVAGRERRVVPRQRRLVPVARARQELDVRGLSLGWIGASELVDSRESPSGWPCRMGAPRDRSEDRSCCSTGSQRRPTDSGRRGRRLGGACRRPRRPPPAQLPPPPA